MSYDKPLWLRIIDGLFDSEIKVEIDWEMTKILWWFYGGAFITVFFLGFLSVFWPA